MAALRYTEEQQACIECLRGPVDISAGAGSGKTFTLSQRIAYALSSESGPAIDSIDKVLAITFTEKAASEIKSRVRSTLRSQGLFDQALRVDTAWISTIHGACARILRAHALELGIDPGFSVITDRDQTDMLSAAIAEVVGEDSEIVSRSEFDALFEVFPAKSVGFNSASVSSMVETLVTKAAGMVDGFDGFVKGPSSPSPQALAKRLLLAYENICAAYEGAKLTETLKKNRAAAQVAIEALEVFLGRADASYSDLITVLDSCAFLSKRGCPSEESIAYQQVHTAVAREAFLALGEPLLDDLLTLARRAQRAYERRKREAGVLDNDDLLTRALAALDRDEVARDYEDRFRLVMVDEFQDTNQLQIEIVRRLSGPDWRYLCTVGDAQQSIYRFRGADIKVYRAFRESLAAADSGAHDGSESGSEFASASASGGEAGAQVRPTLLKLSRNFRSHADILAFVRAVCGQPQVFGDEFLDLEAVYDGSGYRASEPRVQIVAATVPAGEKGAAPDIVAAEAQAIAEYFVRMHEAGHPLSDMVILLGKMTHAETYAQAIRDAGFPCVIAGGSLFHRAPEVHVVERLLCSLADMNDTQALFELLTSDMFALSADDMLLLATGFDEANNIPIKRDLSKGFTELAQSQDSLPPGLSHAIELLSKAQREISVCAPSRVLMDVLLDSGWISRLQESGAEGMACIANILKALRFVEDMERNRGFGMARCAAEFSAMIEAGMKEAPGTLSAEGQEAVRIMTIHTSKGLEFPIVALARFSRSRVVSDPLVAEAQGSSTLLSLSVSPSRVTKKGSVAAKAAGKPFVLPEYYEEVSLEDMLKLSQDDLGGAQPIRSQDAFMGDLPAQLVYRELLCEAAREEELAEERRLFYVAATRAKEALLLVCGFKEQKTNPYAAYRGSLDDVRQALCGDELFPTGSAHLEYGGSEAALFTQYVVRAEASAPDEDEGVGENNAVAQDAPDRDVQDLQPIGTMKLWAIEPFAFFDTAVAPRNETGLFSYSSLAAQAHTEQPAIASDDQFTQDARDLQDLQDDKDASQPAADPDKATAFGSAFHRVAQLAALRDPEYARVRLGQLAESYSIQDRERLSAAAERWFTSKLCARAYALRVHEPEVPFYIPFDEEVLEGSIDLLCYDTPAQAAAHDANTQANTATQDVAAQQSTAATQNPAPHNTAALVIDYKTGGHASEQEQALYKKHLLQAQCYALAVLHQGFSEVELVFARVEQDDPSSEDTLQTIHYRFSSHDLPALEDSIRSARRAL